MSTKDDETDSYRDHYARTEPEPGRLTSSPEARRLRRERQIGKRRVTIRLDEDVIEQFKELASGEGYQTLINQALHEWLAAQGVRELLEQELPRVVQEAMDKARNPSAA